MTMKARITGVHDTSVGELPGSSCMSLHVEAAQGALADAGLAPADIDGVLANSSHKSSASCRRSNFPKWAMDSKALFMFLV